MFLSFYFRTVEFYLGKGVTWVVGFNECGVLAWFALVTLLCVFASYLRFSDTWVHVVIETGLPVFWLYLGTCYD